MVTFTQDILQQLISQGYKYILKKNNLAFESDEVEVLPLKSIFHIRQTLPFVQDKTTLFICDINGEFADELANGVMALKVLINR